jgi:hypothetical protein
LGLNKSMLNKSVPNKSVRKKSMRNIFGFLFLVTCAAISATAVIAEASAETSIDPTRPSGFSSVTTTSTKTPTDNALRLTMIRLGPQPLAIINGQALRPGETIAGQRLQSIQPGHVVLSGSQGQRTLALLPSLKLNAPSSTPILKRRPTL